MTPSASSSRGAQVWDFVLVNNTVKCQTWRLCCVHVNLHFIPSVTSIISIVIVTTLICITCKSEHARSDYNVSSATMAWFVTAIKRISSHNSNVVQITADEWQCKCVSEMDTVIVFTHTEKETELSQSHVIYPSSICLDFVFLFTFLF